MDSSECWALTEHSHTWGFLGLGDRELFSFFVCDILRPQPLWGPWDSWDQFPEVGLKCPSELKVTFEVPTCHTEESCAPGLETSERPFPSLDPSLHHACHRYFDHRHVIRLRR